jgi:hypothetical protein
VVAFTALHPLGLLAAEAYRQFHKRQPIALPGDDHRLGVDGREQERGPREINEDSIWNGQR